MRRAGKIIGTAFVGLLLLSCVFSCVREDRSNCPPPLTVAQTLKVTLTMAPGGADLTPTPEDLKLAVVYLFDGAGSRIATWTKQNPALNTPYDTGIVLEKGKSYRMVTWINPIEPYSITPSYATRSDLSEGRLELTVPPDGTVTGTIPMLLYGSMDAVSTPQADAPPADVQISFNTHRISLTMKGLPQDKIHTLRVSDNSIGFDFNNQPIPAPGFTYLTEIPAPDEEGNSTTMLRMLELDGERSPQLSIVDSSGDTVFPVGGAASVGLMELLDQAGIDPETTRILNIEVDSPEPGASTMTVYINGWKAVLDGYVVY